MSETGISRYDTAELLKDEDTIHHYIEAAFETGEPEVIAKALGTVARARNVSELARQTGMSRTSLYKALSGHGRPELSTILKVARALGFRLTVEPLERDAA